MVDVVDMKGAPYTGDSSYVPDQKMAPTVQTRESDSSHAV